MRYYAIDNEGKIHGESDDLKKLELLIRDCFSDEEIEEKEIEIIEEILA